MHKILTGRAGRVRQAAAGGRPVRLPEPGRVRARRRRELPRLHRAVLRRRAGQGVRAARRGPARRRGDRRRRAHRRHGLGGAEQHRRRPRTAGWSSSSTTTAGPTRRPSAASPTTSPTLRTNPRLRAGPRPGQAAGSTRTPVVGPAGVRRAARDEEGHEGRRRPAGHVRGPRPEVRRPDRRPRPRRVEHALRQAKRFGGPVIVHVHHPQGLRLRARPSDTRPTSSTARRRSTSRPASRSPAAGTIWTDVFADEMVAIGARARRRRRRSPPRCCTRSAWTRSPRAYPDRIFDVGIAEQHAATSAAGLAMGGLHPVVAVYATFLNRAFDQVLMDVALHQLRRHVRARPRRRHRRRRRQPQRHVGHVDPRRSCPGLRLAAPRDADHAARGAARGGRGRRRARPWCASRRAPSGADLPARRAGSAACDVLRPRRRTDVLVVGVGSMAATCRRGRRAAAPRRASASPSSTRAGSSRSPERSSDLAAGAPAGGQRRGQRPRRRRRRRGARRPCATPASTTPLRDFGIPQQFLDHAKRAEVLERIGLTAQDIARGIVEAVTEIDGRLEQHPVSD